MVNGSKVRELREGLEMSQAELADAVGCSQQLVSFIERDFKSPGVDILKRIADKFGIAVDDLLKGASPRSGS